MLSPHLQGNTLAWLAENTRPVLEQLLAEAEVRQKMVYWVALVLRGVEVVRLLA